MLHGDRTERWLAHVTEEDLPAGILKDLRELQDENRDLRETLRAEIRKDKQRPYFLLTFVSACMWMPAWLLGQQGIPSWFTVVLIGGGILGAALSLSHALSVKVAEKELVSRIARRSDNPW